VKRWTGAAGPVPWELVPAGLPLVLAAFLGVKRKRAFVAATALATLALFAAAHHRLVPQLDAALSARAGAAAILEQVREKAELGVVLAAGEEPPDGFLFATAHTLPVVAPADAVAWTQSGSRLVLSRAPVEGLAVVGSASVGRERLVLSGPR
jgi:hypothetical protein